MGRDSSIESYVKRLIKAFLRAGSLRSVGDFETSSKLFSRLFLKKGMLAFSVSVPNTLPYGDQNTLSSTWSCNISTWGGDIYG